MPERKTKLFGAAAAGAVIVSGGAAEAVHLAQDASHVRPPVIHDVPVVPHDVPVPPKITVKIDPVPQDPPPVPKGPSDNDALTHVTSNAVDALFDDPVVSEEIKQAIRLVREYRAGALTEKKIAAATCAVLAKDAGRSRDHDQFKAGIYEAMDLDPGTVLGQVLDPSIEKVTNAIVVAHKGGPRAGLWYYQYCVRGALTKP